MNCKTELTWPLTISLPLHPEIIRSQIQRPPRGRVLSFFLRIPTRRFPGKTPCSAKGDGQWLRCLFVHGLWLLPGLSPVQEFLDFAADGFSPDIITLVSKMQEILHDFFANGFVGFKELVTDIHVINRATGIL